MGANTKMDEDGESCWNCLQGWEWMWILYFWAKTRHDGDVFPVFQVKRQCWGRLLEKKFSEPGVFSDEQTRVNFVVEEAINQWGDEDPVFGMDEVFFLEALASCWGGWNIHLPATNKWAEWIWAMSENVSDSYNRWTNGSECEDRKFLFWSTDWVSEDGCTADKKRLMKRRKSFRDLNMNNVVFTSVPQICVSYMSTMCVMHVRYVCHTCQTCVSDKCAIHVCHKCMSTLFKQTFGSKKIEREDRTTIA